MGGLDPLLAQSLERCRLLGIFTLKPLDLIFALPGVAAMAGLGDIGSETAQNDAEDHRGNQHQGERHRIGQLRHRAEGIEGQLDRSAVGHEEDDQENRKRNEDDEGNDTRDHEKVRRLN